MLSQGHDPHGRCRCGAGRRRLLQSLMLLAAPCFAASRSFAAPYPATLAAMKLAHEAETRVHQHYTACSQQAQKEGYRGVAYLFTALAASERVHATNFGAILVRLGGELPPAPRPAPVVADTRQNLIRAADGEMASIDDLYPKMLAQIRPEGHAEAIASVNYAWASEQQHRDKIRQIQRWSPSMFEVVARTIDQKTGRYFVCQVCGSTVNKVPAERCPVCSQPPSNYRAIEPPA